MKNLFLFLIVLLVLGLLPSCSRDDSYSKSTDVITTGTDIISLVLTDKKGNDYNSFLIDDSTIHVCVPNNADLTDIKVRVVHNGKSANIGDFGEYLDHIDMTDFVNPYSVRVTSSQGHSKERYIIIYNLPVLLIETPDRVEITSKTEKTEGCILTLIDGEGGVDSLGTAGIEGRGNSTWHEPKKPYNVKLDKKRSILGMHKSKQWVLLANAFWDRTQMHNAIAYEMARKTDYAWVQDGRFIELLFNGKHKGLYYLCEKIRIEDDRINISIMDETDTIPGKMNGGYLLETAFTSADGDFQTDYFNKTDAGKPLFWEIKKPEETLHVIQAEYIKSEMNYLERLLLNEDSVIAGSYRNLLDIESAINWMLVNEVSVNQETLNPSNLFIYKDKGGLLKFGPPWDFDAHTFGVYGEHKCFLQRPTFYFYWMMKDPVFVERLKIKWASYKTIWLEEIPFFIDQLYAQLYPSALRNEQMWPNWHIQYQYPEKTYAAIISDMKAFFVKQIEYVDNIISAL